MALFQIKKDFFVSPHFFVKDKIIFFAGILSLVLNMAAWFLLIFKLPHGDNFLTLHYNIYFGVDKFGPWWKALYLPALGVIIFILNGFFSYFFYKKEKFLSRIIIISSVVAELIFLAAASAIILVN